MATLTLKGIPDELLDRLRRRAELHRRSLNSEALYVLEQSVGPVRFDPEEMLARVRAVRAEIGEVIPLTPEMFEEAVNEGRP
ncbi:MAG TPA: Arc family DNA-binding protein [Longimicrobium sp.]